MCAVVSLLILNQLVRKCRTKFAQVRNPVRAIKLVLVFFTTNVDKPWITMSFQLLRAKKLNLISQSLEKLGVLGTNLAAF